MSSLIENDFGEIVEYIDYDDYLVEKDYIMNVQKNINYNQVILSYYKRLYDEFIDVDERMFDVFKKEGRVSSIVKFKDDIKISSFHLTNPYNVSKTVLGNIEKCNKFWYMNVYKYSQIKDFIGTNLCHDKFCNNCKKVKQACRMSRYIPELEKYKDRLYHLTLTIPNCPGKDLKIMIKKMAVSFRKLIRYLNLTKKLGFLNLSQYGFEGAVRSLEITFRGDSYHPHYHVALVLAPNLELEEKYKNVYSTDFFGSRGERLFSELEIIIQKLWYMCMNDIYISPANFSELEVGYSCIIDKFKENDYAELFKYMTKETDENKNILTYDNFKTLYLSTRLVKQIQGYGCLYQINDSNVDEEIDKVYDIIKMFLSQEEDPELCSQQPKELLNDFDYTLISRKKIYQYLRDQEKMKN